MTEEDCLTFSNSRLDQQNDLSLYMHLGSKTDIYLQVISLLDQGKWALIYILLVMKWCVGTGFRWFSLLNHFVNVQARLWSAVGLFKWELKIVNHLRRYVHQDASKSKLGINFPANCQWAPVSAGNNYHLPPFLHTCPHHCFRQHLSKTGSVYANKSFFPCLNELLQVLNLFLCKCSKTCIFKKVLISL